MICPPVIKREKVVATVMNNYLTSLLTSSQLADILALPSLAVPFARAAKYFPSAKFECERFLSFGIAAERGYKAGCAWDLGNRLALQRLQLGYSLHRNNLLIAITPCMI